MKILPLAISGRFDLEKYKSGKACIEKSLDLHNWVSDTQLRASPNINLNGTDIERLSELESALESKSADLVWTIRGGYGVTRLLSKIPSDLNLNQKLLIGFSDITALMLYLWGKYKTKSLHAPNITTLSEESPEVLEALKKILNNNMRNLKYPSFASLRGVADDVAIYKGILLPCNLCMLTQLLGTPFMPDLSGSILILEEVNEAPYKLDRMLTHLYNSDCLSGVKAIVVGNLTGCGQSAQQVFIERCESFKIPCFVDFKMGHRAPNWPVPMGVLGKINTKGKQACLTILEELF